MRFVVACEEGHLDDLDWRFWAHFGAKSEASKQCASSDLRFESTRGGDTGLGSLYVKCLTCNARRSLAGISSKDSLKPMNVSCSGRQPWQYERGSCAAIPQVLQRGATNLYFAQVESALDIPPGSRFDPLGEVVLEVTNSSEFAVIRANPSGDIASGMAALIADRVGIKPSEVMDIVRAEINEAAGSPVSELDDEDLAAGEWRAFVADNDESDDRHRFVTNSVEFTDLPNPPQVESLLGNLIDRVVLATRLREVRALTGFTRLKPEGTKVSPDLGVGLDWLPAIEIFGEGIFISLDEQQLRAWEDIGAQRQAAGEIEERRQRSLFGPRMGVEASPRFILLHTLAHLLIRQLAFDCGYASSSLRERIYSRESNDPSRAQAGILIYTAAGDVEGTLGGLVRQGEPPLLSSTILSALEAAAWCSSDPLCSESPGQGFGALNRGACHACALVSETSCGHFNAILDRGFVVGSGKVRGFFSEVVEKMAEESAEA